MRLAPLRWLLLPAAAVSGAMCVFGRLTPARAVLAVAAGLGWYAASRAKVRSLDREVLGIPPRR